jgi:hypothetical protein
MILNERQRILLEVVRGHKPWSILPQHGFRVSYYDGRWEFGVNSESPLRVSRSDISEGLLGLLARPNHLRDWASFILSGSSLVDLEDVEDYDLLLEALWDASFGEQVKQSARDLESRLKAEGCKGKKE